MLSPAQLDALDRCDRIASCWAAISDLLVVDSDAIQHRERDHLATLTGFLAEEYHLARAAFSRSIPAR